jgi:hypothetical protein
VKRPFWQDVEKVLQLRSRGTPPPHHLGGVHKRAAPYSARREPQKLNVPESKTNPKAMPGERRGSAWAGEISGLFEHPAGHSLF